YQQPSDSLAFVPQPANAFITAFPDDPANGNLLVAGNWYHCVVTEDNTNWNFYINGELRSSAPVAGIDYVPNGYGINPDGSAGIGGDDGGNTVIGERTDGAFGTFEGAVDEAAIYNYALSPAQIYAHYINGLQLTIAKVGTNVVVTWPPEGKLQQATSARAAFADVPGASSPYTNAVSAAPKFYRARVLVP